MVLLKKTDCNAKITETDGKIPSISGLAAIAALTAVENKIPNISSFVRKTDYNTKITEIEKKLTAHNHDKYITNPEINNVSADVLNARLGQANLITKIDFHAKLSSRNRKITANKTKHFLVENDFKKLKTFDSSYFIGKNYFEEDRAQNYLVFQPMYKCLKTISNTDNISEWKSKGLPDEVIKPPDNSLTPTLGYDSKIMYLEFNGGCLKQDKITYNRGKIVNIYIVYDLKSTLNYNADFTLENCLFGAVKLTKNADIDKYKYFGYGIGFDGVFSHPAGSFGNNSTIFGVDMSSIIFGVHMSSCVHIDNKKRHFNSWKGSNTRIRRAFINCRKNTFNQF